ncbi:hypothetical protein V5799_006510 [Amblyomma americanum]|uniref:Uncharacterized protein n=1 Tax=Amblyomma americanum TaxID=6943 RepID=A0AAQ4DW71_AMBAM
MLRSPRLACLGIGWLGPRVRPPEWLAPPSSSSSQSWRAREKIGFPAAASLLEASFPRSRRSVVTTRLLTSRAVAASRFLRRVGFAAGHVTSTPGLAASSARGRELLRGQPRMRADLRGSVTSRLSRRRKVSALFRPDASRFVSTPSARGGAVPFVSVARCSARSHGGALRLDPPRASL